MPDRQSQFPACFEHSQHLANCVNGRCNEHHSEPAHNGIEAIGREWQIVCKGDIKLCVPESTLVCRSASGCDHLRDRIDANDLAFGPDNGRYVQGWLSGPRSNIKNCMSAANQRILDQSLRDRRKHLPDRFAMLLPERRSAAPSVDHSLVALHRRKYSSGRITRNLDSSVAPIVFSWPTIHSMASSDTCFWFAASRLAWVRQAVCEHRVDRKYRRAAALSSLIKLCAPWK